MTEVLGALFTGWFIGAVAAYFIFDWSVESSLLWPATVVVRWWRNEVKGNKDES